jgi:hypothetical protein
MHTHISSRRRIYKYNTVFIITLYFSTSRHAAHVLHRRCNNNNNDNNDKNNNNTNHNNDMQ